MSWLLAFERVLSRTDRSIPYDQIDAHLAPLPDKDAKMVVYLASGARQVCRSGRMSAIVARRLVELGYTHVYDLTGGMVVWEANGRSLSNR
jgi:rhodanese-related sulfurtransferase